MLDEVVLALGEAGLLLRAGVLAFPPKMVEPVTVLVQEALAAQYLAALKAQEDEAIRQIARVDPDANAEVAPPKLTPAVRKLLQEAAENAQDEHMHDLESAWKNSRRFETRVPGIDLLTGDDLRESLERLGRVNTLDGMDELDLRIVWHLLNSSASTAAQKASDKLLMWLQDRIASADLPPIEESTNPSHAAFVKQMEMKIDAIARLRTFYHQFAKGPRKKPKYTWTVPVDLTGMPANYKLVEKTWPEVTVTLSFVPRIKRFAGKWKMASATIELITVGGEDIIVPDEALFARVQKNIKDTLEHELRHMVQTMLAHRLRQEDGPAANRLVYQAPYNQAGTPFTRKTRPPSDGNKAAKSVYPKATDKERYYLDPIEFFPQVASAEERYRNAHKDLGAFKAWVGLETREDVPVYPFFAALKKHDARLYKRAVGEMWNALRDLANKPLVNEELLATLVQTYRDRWEKEGATMPVFRQFVALDRTGREPSAALEHLKEKSAREYRTTVKELWRRLRGPKKKPAPAPIDFGF